MPDCCILWHRSDEEGVVDTQGKGVIGVIGIERLESGVAVLNDLAEQVGSLEIEPPQPYVPHALAGGATNPIHTLPAGFRMRSNKHGGEHAAGIRRTPR